MKCSDRPGSYGNSPRRSAASRKTRQLQLRVQKPSEALAEHFAHKMSNAKGVQEGEYIPPDPLRARVRMPLVSWKIRYRKVLRTLQRLDTNKSVNGIAPNFLSECAKELAPVLTKLFKFIVRQAKYPSTWKDGRVTALHKRDSVVLAETDRPLIVLTNVSLVFGTVIDDQFDLWVTKLAFSRAQCGTADNGAAMSSKIHDELERRNDILIVTLDVKGAFDRVWWTRLKNRLAAKGMKGKALRLLEDYLHERHIQDLVVAGGKSSATHHLVHYKREGIVLIIREILT